MGWKLKGQNPRMYRPSVQRRASGLSNIDEYSRAQRLWGLVQKNVRERAKLERIIKAQGFYQRGRFKVYSPSPPRGHYRRGRFVVSSLPKANKPFERRGRFKVYAQSATPRKSPVTPHGTSFKRGRFVVSSLPKTFERRGRFKVYNS